ALCNFWACCPAVLANDAERFSTAHASEPPREGDRGLESRTIEFNGSHDLSGSLLAGPLLSRAPCLGARRRRLLFLGIDAGSQGIHEIDHLRRRTLFCRLDFFASLFLFE